MELNSLNNRMNLKRKKNTLSQIRESVVTCLAIIICLFLLKMFPTKDLFEQISVLMSFFVIIPALYIKLILKKEFADFGIQEGNWKKGLIFAGVSLIFSFLIIYLMFHYTNFSKNYTLPVKFSVKFIYFALYELLLVSSYLIFYELFFRGFVMFSFIEKIDYLAPLIQFLLFLVFSYFVGYIIWDNTLYILTAFFSGWIAWESRSLIYSFAYSLIFIIITDAIVIKLAK